MVVSANDSNRIYAATRTGIFRSTDAGASWSKVYALPLLNQYNIRLGVIDLAIRTDKTPDTLIASVGKSYIPEAPGQIIRTTDGGDAWTTVHTSIEQGRASLAIAPSNQNFMYALVALYDLGSVYNNGLSHVARSTDGGLTWEKRVTFQDETRLNTLLLSNPIFGMLDYCYGESPEMHNQGWYNNVIAVDPTNPNIVWAGGNDLFRSNDGGKNWGVASWWYYDPSNPLYVHADHHALVFHPDYNGVTNQKLYDGSDGGIQVTENARSSMVTTAANYCSPITRGHVQWHSLNNGYGVTQFYHGTVYPGGEQYFGGTQDNGSIRGGTTTGNNAWKEINGGDGGYTSLNTQNTDILYTSYVYKNLYKSTDGGNTFVLATDGIDEPSSNYQFIAPHAMDPSARDTLWFGGSMLWRTTDGTTTWVQAKTPDSTLTGMTAVAVNPSDSNHVLAAYKNGTIIRNSNALAATSETVWDSATLTNSRVYISSLAFDPQNGQTVYATNSVFGQSHVWKSTDGGATWNAIDGDLPDVPAHTLLVNPTDSDILYLGTDIGVFVTLNGGASWARSNDQFPNVITEWLTYDQQSNTIFAFTHGRGVFSVPATVTGTKDQDYAGWWYSQDELGSGMSMEIQGSDLFLGWFSYNTAGQPVWYTAQPTRQGDTLFTNGTIYATTGWPFQGEYTPPVYTEAGTLSVAFSSSSQGTITHNLTGQDTTLNVQRMMTDATYPGPLHPRQITGWWKDTSKNGMGWFAEVKGESLYVGWCHYDEFGDPRWWVLGGDVGNFPADQTSFTGQMVEYTGGSAPGSTSSTTARENKGEATITFNTNGSATFTFGQTTYNLQRATF